MSNLIAAFFAGLYANPVESAQPWRELDMVELTGLRQILSMLFLLVLGHGRQAPFDLTRKQFRTQGIKVFTFDTLWIVKEAIDSGQVSYV